MSDKPKNVSELVRFLTANPELTVQFSDKPMVIHGNTGPSTLPVTREQVQRRRFVKKSGNDFILQVVGGEKDGQQTRFQFKSTKEFVFFDDRFEVPGWRNDVIKYFYGFQEQTANVSPPAEVAC